MQTPAEDLLPRAAKPPLVIPNNLKQLRDKHGACAGCDDLPPEGQTFRACSACKAVLYCSKECQKTHWKDHRYVVCQRQLTSYAELAMFRCSERCKITQLLKQPEAVKQLAESCTDHDHSLCEDPSWPASLDASERSVIMNRFIELHRTTLHLTISHLREALWRHGKDVDIDRQTLAFWFGYRAASDGNPATRLFLKRVELVEQDVKEMRKRETKMMGWDEGLGKLAVDFRGGGVHGGVWMPLEPKTPQAAGQFNAVPIDWITHMRFATTTGLIMASEESKGPKVFGWVMRKQGKEWKRTKIPDAEVQRLWQRYYRDKGPEPEVVMGSLSRFLRPQ